VRPDKIPFFEIPPEFAAKIEPYVSDLENKLVELIGSALAALRTAVFSVRETTVGFTRNRRSADGPQDRAVPVLEVTGTDRKPLAMIFGYACHNLTLAPEFCQYHGDYAGLAQRTLENAFPGSTALFLSGAGADLDPFPRGTLELTEQHGHSLADAVQKALAEPGHPVSGALCTRFEEVSLDFVPLPSLERLTLAATLPVPEARKAKFMVEALRNGRQFPSSYPCPVQILRLGNQLLLIALGGEPVADYALQFKAEFKGPVVWVAGYSNDGFGYLPNRRVQREGGYEGGRSLFWSELPGPFTESVEERVRGAVRTLVAGV
jgi:hypothetical protein